MNFSKKVSIHKDFSTPSQEALIYSGFQNNVPSQPKLNKI